MKKLALLTGLLLLCGCRTVSSPATSADGVPIAYRVAGSGNPAIVFIHGWSSDGALWSEQAAALEDEFRVVTLDLAGHGDSGGLRTDWTLARFGDDVAAVVRQLELARVILVGHSMGGPVALEAALQMPERVAGIVAVDTLHDADKRYDPVRWQSYVARFERDFAKTCEEEVRKMFPDEAKEEAIQQALTEICSPPPDSEVAVEILRHFPDYDLGAAMEQVEAPIRCIYSDLYPTNLEANRERTADFDSVTMEGVGHFPMIERPEEFNSLLFEQIRALAAAAG